MGIFWYATIDGVFSTWWQCCLMPLTIFSLVQRQVKSNHGHIECAETCCLLPPCVRVEECPADWRWSSFFGLHLPVWWWVQLAVYMGLCEDRMSPKPIGYSSFSALFLVEIAIFVACPVFRHHDTPIFVRGGLKPFTVLLSSGRLLPGVLCPWWWRGPWWGRWCIFLYTERSTKKSDPHSHTDNGLFNIYIYIYIYIYVIYIYIQLLIGWFTYRKWRCSVADC